MLFWIILIVVIVLMGKYIYELHQFNHSAQLIQLQNPNKSMIQETIWERHRKRIKSYGTICDKEDPFSIYEILI